MNILPTYHLGVGAPDDNDEKHPTKNSKRRKYDTHGGRIIRSTGGKDRHSKVRTARGPRDRRLRLSPKTAISFYDVQERLGYDRPSKAIDWLMKEAKSAIDALEQPPPNVANTEHLNNDDLIFNFGEERISPVPPLATTPETFAANFEIARLQRIFSWNYVSSVSPTPPPPPLHFPTPVDLGHGYMFTGREPLQSRISNYSTTLFPAVNFSNEELLNFAGAATFKEDEMDIFPVSSQSYSTASFLH